MVACGLLELRGNVLATAILAVTLKVFLVYMTSLQATLDLSLIRYSMHEPPR